MAENQNDNNLDELLNDIALEPDNNGDDVIPVNESLEIDDKEVLEVAENESSEDDDVLEDLEDDIEYAVQKKQTRLQKILIGVAAGLVVIIILGLIAYFMGLFDPEQPKEEMKKPVVMETVEKKKPEFNFKEKDINVDRLNKKLNLLTKYEIIEDVKKEEEKELEKKRLEEEAQKKLEDERLAKINRIRELEKKRVEEELAAKKREEELLNNYKKEEEKKTQPEEVKVVVEEPKVEEPVKEDVITVTKDDKDITVSYEVTPTMEETAPTKEETLPDVQVVAMEEPTVQEPVEMEMPKEEMEISDENEEQSLENNFIKFIVITTNKKDIFKKELTQITSIDNQVKLCRDDSNNIEVFVGPYEESERDIKLAVFNYALKNQTVEALDFTQEEFDKRCNF